MYREIYKRKICSRQATVHYSNCIYVFFSFYFPPISFKWWGNSKLHLVCFNMLSVMACCSLITMLSTSVSLLEFSFPCRAKAVRLILVWCQLPIQHKRKHCEVRPQSVSFFFPFHTVVTSLFGSSPCDVETKRNSSIIICPSSKLSKKVHNTLLMK